VSVELGPKSSRDVVVHRVRAREPWVFATFIALLIPTLALAVTTAHTPWLFFLAAFGGGGMFGGAILLFAYWLWKRATRLDADKTARRGRATARGVWIDDRLQLPRENIVGAFVSPSWPNGAYVRVHRRLGFPVEFWTADVEGAHALVAGLGLDASRVVGIATGASVVDGPFKRLLLGASVIALALMLITISPALSFFVAPLAGLFGALSLLPQKFIVGTDGILIRWLGRRVGFIPIQQIASVEQVPGIVRLHMTNHTMQQLVISSRLGDQAAGIGLQVGLLAERIRSAMRRAGTLEVDTSPLERGERDVGSWVSALRDLARGAGYRAAVQREDLVFVVEDARRPARVRVAAAVALGEADPHERARLRIAAESSSMPELRDALDAVLEGDEERLQSSLGRVE
jgi:hypothetical protein